MEQQTNDMKRTGNLSTLHFTLVMEKLIKVGHGTTEQRHQKNWQPQRSSLHPLLLLQASLSFQERKSGGGEGGENWLEGKVGRKEKAEWMSPCFGQVSD